MAALRAISTRAAITTTRFTNHYERGDLKADPFKLLEKYFDAFMYVTNWGTREFHLRLPQELVEFMHFKSMLPGEAASAQRAGKFVIVSIESEVASEDDHGDRFDFSLASASANGEHVTDSIWSSNHFRGDEHTPYRRRRALRDAQYNVPIAEHGAHHVRKGTSQRIKPIGNPHGRCNEAKTR